MTREQWNALDGEALDEAAEAWPEAALEFAADRYNAMLSRNKWAAFSHDELYQAAKDDPQGALEFAAKRLSGSAFDRAIEAAPKEALKHAAYIMTSIQFKSAAIKEPYIACIYASDDYSDMLTNETFNPPAKQKPTIFPGIFMFLSAAFVAGVILIVTCL